jgi:2,4-dienoyl-CoA reductase-like NADH-dependent reductase (Old Yellow Enzyme family)
MEAMPHLFDPIRFRDLTLPNRVVVSPMCQYSSVDGLANEWHFVHLGSHAVGGAGLVFTEAAAVTAEGRISPEDLGIWSDEHIDPLARIVRFIKREGCAAAMQIAHAGRKASAYAPWRGHGAIWPEQGGWEPIAPTPVPFAEGFAVPREMTASDIAHTIEVFRQAAARAAQAGFDLIEIHAAHGYLIHEFLSPITNHRTDEYGGSFENRIRLCLQIVDAVRGVWPERQPLFMRISATDWAEGGWDIDEAVELARRVSARGVDLIDCSSGGTVFNATIPMAAGYQVPFAERIKREASVATGAVGLITTPAHADEIVRRDQADIVLLAREMLRDPYWPLRAARELGHAVPWPAQYLRAAPSGTPARP